MILFAKFLTCQDLHNIKLGYTDLYIHGPLFLNFQLATLISLIQTVSNPQTLNVIIKSNCENEDNGNMKIYASSVYALPFLSHP